MAIEEEMCSLLSVEQSAEKDDKYYCSFFYKAIKQLLDIDVESNALYLRRYFEIFFEYCDFWCQVKDNIDYQDREFVGSLKNLLFYRISFIYRNAPLLSSAVAFHFRRIYKNSPEKIKRLVRKKLVRICSLGGCAVSDIVAVVTFLESNALKEGVELDFRVTIIESDERWKIACITVLRCLKQFSNDTWKITFIHANFARNDAWTPETCTAIQEADIITMIRFFPNLIRRKDIMKKICNKSQPQSILFMLDHPAKELVELFLDTAYSTDLQLIHHELWDFHPLDISAVKHYEDLYPEPLRIVKETRAKISFSVLIGVWIKKSEKFEYKNNLECIFKNDMEKFNPKLTFLTDIFYSWEELFKEEREIVGLTAEGIREFIQKENEIRSYLLKKLNNKSISLNEIQKYILSKYNSLNKEEKESNIIFKKYLYAYLTMKSNYAYAKRVIYYRFFHIKI